MVKTECLGKYDICNETETCGYSGICGRKFWNGYEWDIEARAPWYERRTLFNGYQEPESLELGICGCGPQMRRVLNLGAVKLCKKCIIRLYEDAGN